jgi:hypothetical protein
MAIASGVSRKNDTDTALASEAATAAIVTAVLAEAAAAARE